MKIVAIDPLILFNEDKKHLGALGDFIAYDTKPKDTDDLYERVKDADIIIDFWHPLSADIINKLSKTKLIVSAASGGKVEIVAPIPGRSLIGIIAKKPKKETKNKSEKYKIIRVKEKQYVTFDNFERFRNAVALVLYLLGQGIFKLADKIQSPHDVRFSKDENEEESK